LAGRRRGATFRPLDCTVRPHWRRDPDFASVRDPQALDRLSEDERTARQALWRDVDALAERVAKKDEPIKGRK
jgi:hypothetical protein